MVTMGASAGVHLSLRAAQSSSTAIAEVFFCMKWQSFVLGLCSQSRFSRVHPPASCCNVTIVLLLCRMLHGINEDGDTEIAIANHFGLCVLLVFQASSQPR